jgi:hypothetical protein
MSKNPLAVALTQILVEIEATEPTPLSDQAAMLADGLHGPLRVAVAGRPKTGKSTLINALVQHPIAPTGLSAKVGLPTWYRFGVDAAAEAITINGRRRPIGYQLGDPAAGTDPVIDLASLPSETIRRLEVTAPVEALTNTTVMDLPGHHPSGARPGEPSLTADRVAAERNPPRPSDHADVVLYLLRSAHETDLEALRDLDRRGGSSIDEQSHAIGLLARADEVGGGRADALHLAHLLGRRLATELSPLTESVRPVSGLLDVAASTLDDDDLQALKKLSTLPANRLDQLIRSAGDFAGDAADTELSVETRQRLIERLGLHGVRWTVGLVAAKGIDVAELPSLLAAQSGLAPLRRLLIARFAKRSDAIRAAAAARATADLVACINREPIRERLARDLDRAVAESHDLQELLHLRALNLAGDVRLGPERLEALERYLGGYGDTPHERLGAHHSADQEEIRALALQAKRNLAGWPRARGTVRRAVAAADRSIDRVLANLDGWFR